MNLMTNHFVKLPAVKKKAEDLNSAVSKLRHVMNDEDLDEKIRLLKEKVRDKLNLQGDFYTALRNDKRWG